MAQFKPPESNNVLLGLALALCGNAVFSLQDAVVKWLVADYAVFQVLFTRSVVIVAISIAFTGRTVFRGIWKSPNKPSLLLRAGCMLTAWLCYYTAARSLKLPDLVTLYYSSPLIITVMSIFLLNERVRWYRWLAVGVGFAGVVVAANPTGRADLLPAGLVLVAASLWALANILMRRISSTESTEVQMMFTSGSMALFCGATLPWLWHMPSLFDAGLMLGIGCVAGLGQYLLFESIRHAPASVVAPVSYTSLAWAFLWGLVIWGDFPDRAVFTGAGLILCGSLIVVVSEWRNARARRRAAADAL